VDLPTAIRALHLLAAVTWIGGMLFVALILVPVARGFDPALRARLFHAVGVRFRAIGWIALAVLVATGVGNLVSRPYLLDIPRFQAKLGLVVVAFALAAAHDFVFGPRAGAPGADPRWRVRATWTARINVLVVLAILTLGVALRG
jgi:uncharacterized membrane protein